MKAIIDRYKALGQESLAAAKKARVEHLKEVQEASCLKHVLRVRGAAKVDNLILKW